MKKRLQNVRPLKEDVLDSCIEKSPEAFPYADEGIVVIEYPGGRFVWSALEATTLLTLIHQKGESFLAHLATAAQLANRQRVVRRGIFEESRAKSHHGGSTQNA